MLAAYPFLYPSTPGANVASGVAATCGQENPCADSRSAIEKILIAFMNGRQAISKGRAASFTPRRAEQARVSAPSKAKGAGTIGCFLQRFALQERGDWWGFKPPKLDRPVLQRSCRSTTCLRLPQFLSRAEVFLAKCKHSETLDKKSR